MSVEPTAIIAEDEGAQRAELRAALAELWPELRIVAECEDGLAALEAVEQHRPTVAFLDICMPGVSGLAVAQMASAHSHVVMTTAFGQFALESYDHGAADYLLKPIKRERLMTAIARLRKRIADGQASDVSGVVAALRGTVPEAKSRRISWISASVGENIRMISIDDIVCFKSEDKYTCVVAAGGSAHIRTPLKELLPQLDPEVFWQVHRSAIVRVAAIESLRRDEDGKLKIALAGQRDLVPVSAAFQDRFRPM
ncbi:MAG TPA: LytTR family DNA-binding domain-containing protein [Telluria sp.]|nr:LytTR family DNA-binding domain-containing protein [Telluria sp.]